MTPLTRKDETRRRRAVAQALLVLRKAVGERASAAADRIRVARAYRVLGDAARAATWYRSAMDELSERGEAVKALAVAKEMSEVTPQERRAFADLADRFAQSARDPSTRIAVPLPGRQPPSPDRVLDAKELLKVYEAEYLGASADAPDGGLLPSLVPPDVLEELHVRGEIDLFDTEGQLISRPEEQPPVVSGESLVPDEGEAIDPEEIIRRLKKLPLFSELDREAFYALAQAVKLRTVGNDCLVFREGEEATSFFLIAEGSVEILRRLQKREVVLRHFQAGEAFGLFGLFAGKKRAANARAIGNVSVLEVPAGALANIVRTHPKARLALARFFKERLLENFLGSSPVFADLDPVARRQMIDQFKERRLAPGQPVVSPGEVFNGLFLVIAGRMAITKRVGAREEQLASLEKGQFFGIVTALTGHPCHCTIAAEIPSTVSILPQKSFNEFVKSHPALRDLPRRLAAEGMLVEKDVFVGDSGVPGFS